MEKSIMAICDNIIISQKDYNARFVSQVGNITNLIDEKKPVKAVVNIIFPPSENNNDFKINASYEIIVKEIIPNDLKV